MFIIRSRNPWGDLHSPHGSLGGSSYFSASAHTMMVRSCALKSPTRSSTTLADGTSRGTCGCPAFAYVHAVLARRCGLTSPKPRSTILANAANNCAYADAVLVMCCGSNRLTRYIISYDMIDNPFVFTQPYNRASGVPRRPRIPSLEPCHISIISTLSDKDQVG